MQLPNKNIRPRKKGYIKTHLTEKKFGSLINYQFL